MIPFEFISRTSINIADFKGKLPKYTVESRLIENSTVLLLEGNKPLIYLNLDDPAFDYLIPHLISLEFNPSNRVATGKNNFSILVGGVTARTNYTEFCNVGSLLRQNTYLHHALVQDVSHELKLIFEAILPQWAKICTHFYQKADIHTDYQMSDSFWTSAIINYNSQHAYHFDSQNLKNTVSAMITFKKNVSGGYLMLPEYNLGISTSNRSIIFFNGRDILHGVSKIDYHGHPAYRYTIVFYAMQDLIKCQSLREEFSKR